MVRKIGFGLVVLMVVFILIGLLASRTPKVRPTRDTGVTAPATSTAPAADPEREKRRADAEQLIERLQQHQIIGDVRVSNHVGKLVVETKFYGLSFEQKKSFVNVAMVWCQAVDPTCDLLVLRDSRSGKDVGRFGAAYGGLKMD